MTNSSQRKSVSVICTIASHYLFHRHHLETIFGTMSNVSAGTNILKFVTFEIRPLFRSCNVFIALQENINFNEVKVSISEKNVVLSIRKSTVTLHLQDIKLVPSSLSALSIQDNWICFRMYTNPAESTTGSFSAEVIVNPRKQDKNLEQCVSHDNFLLKDSECIISCTCCKNSISKTVTFKKVLPFPDIDYDLSEWFCCQKHDTNSNLAQTLQPKESDCFYGQFFSVLNKDIFSSNLHVTNQMLVCNRCLKSLGKLYENNSVKVWNCCVDYTILNTPQVTKHASRPIDDFFSILRNAMNAVPVEDIVLQSSFGDQIHSVIIKIMSHGLNLLVEPDKYSDTSSIYLERKSVIKVLYRYTTTKIDGSNCTKYCEVCLPIIETAIQYLLSSSKRIPHAHRFTGDYCIGYVNFEITPD